MGSGEPLVFSIQHFCLHDGPGIRSLVFFKGCPLRCPWCQNVESWKPGAETAFKPHLCIGCGTCVLNCPQQALSSPGKRDPGKCRQCFTCAEDCPSGAMTLFGIRKTPEQILEELRPEFPLFRSSGGGVTFTGGEPALYPEFTAELAGLLCREGISTALETSGFFDRELLRPLLQQLTLILFDIKIHDREEHRRICGQDNTVIIENLKALAEASRRQESPALRPRFPLVPGMTDGEKNIRGWAGLLKEAGIPSVTIIPFHPLGSGKRKWLGMPEGPLLRVPDGQDVQNAGQIFLSTGIQVFSPGDVID